jgi:hypothetical protein
MARNHSGELCLSMCNQLVVIQTCFGIEHVSDRHTQAAMTRRATDANQIMPLSVRQSQSGRAQQPQVEPEESPIRTAHVRPGDHLPKRFPQCIASNNTRKVACLAAPAEEEAIMLIIRRVLDESFGEGE